MATFATPAPHSPQSVEQSPSCPGCGINADFRHFGGYAFSSMPDVTPQWEEVAWCEGCGWSEEYRDGQQVDRVIALQIQAPLTPSEFFDAFPPF